MEEWSIVLYFAPGERPVTAQDVADFFSLSLGPGLMRTIGMCYRGQGASRTLKYVRVYFFSRSTIEVILQGHVCIFFEINGLHVCAHEYGRPPAIDGSGSPPPPAPATP